MTKYKGTHNVKVYWHERKNIPPGGSMICIGGYTCPDGCTGWFQFDDVSTMQGGEKVTRPYRVSNVRKPGLYKKNLLRYAY